MDYRPRSQVEDDPSFKQLIPYVVFRCADRVFCYVRGKSQGEARLHHLRSLGVGGHVAEEDAGGQRSREAYESALHRELDEEVAIQSPGRMRLVGLINDDSTAVGQVHLGVVHFYELERPDVLPREEGLAAAEFLTVPTILTLRQEFETWSQICIDSLLRSG
jgi:predicted NUDIX family phosphoesterase